MTIPLIIETTQCRGKIPPPDTKDSGKLNTTARVMVASLIIEPLFVITALVVSILGLLSVWQIPVVLSYSFIILSGFVIALWLISIIRTRKKDDSTLGFSYTLARIALNIKN